MQISVEEFYKQCDALFRAGDKKAYSDYLDGALEESSDAKSSDYEASSLRIAVLNESASWFRSISDFPKSEQLFFDTLSFMKECGLAESAHYARVLLNLAGQYRYTKQLDKAEQYFEESRAIFAGLPESDVVGAASAMNNLALVYAEQGRTEDAMALARQTYDYVLENAGDNDHLVATEMVNIATLLLDCGNTEEAEKALDVALPLFKRMPKENVHLAATYNTYAAVRMKQGNPQAAYEYFLLALDSVERFYGHNIEYATCQQNLARCAKACDMPEAEGHARAALEAMEAILPAEDERIARCRDLLASIKG